MGRVAATAVHLSLCAVAGVLYFLFVIPRWWELVGDTSHTLGTVIRIVVGILIALAALPVIQTLTRTRRPELNTPPLALALRLRAAIAHVLGGVLIVGAAVAEIWLNLDTAGPWLYAAYGAAAALAILGVLGFYLAFVAEMPPAPPKAKKVAESSPVVPEETPDEAPEEAPEETEAAVAVSDPDESPAPDDEVADPGEPAAPETPAADTPAADDVPEEPTDEPAGGIRNKRPSGKSGHRLRRRERGSLAVEE